MIYKKELLVKIEGASDDEISEIVFGAMDEYAQQEAIEFEKWKIRNEYKHHSNGYYSNEPPTAGKQTWFTITELYTLYQQSKEVKPGK